MNGYTNDAACSISLRSRVSNSLAVKVMLLTAMCIVSGCSSIQVYSNPPGANVLINGTDTGMITPASIRVRHLPLGRTYITVEKEGYQTLTSRQAVEVGVSIGNILWSWWPPVLIKNLCGDLWKGITYPRNRRLEEFNMQVALGDQSATTTIASAVSAMPVSEQPKRKPTTNTDVVAMLKANLSEATIITAIKQGPSDFDTSPSALIELKNQGATAGILEAMMQPQAQVFHIQSQSYGKEHVNVAQVQEDDLNNNIKCEQTVIAQKPDSSGIDKPEDKLDETSTYEKKHQTHNKSGANSIISYKGGNYYIVQPGDTLGDISRKTLGTSRYWRKIADHNNITDPSNLFVGQRVLIPTDIALQSTNTPPEKDSSSNLNALNASSEETVTVENDLANQQKKNQNLPAAEQPETTQITSQPQQKEEQKGWVKIISNTSAEIKEKPNPFSKVVTTLPPGTRLPWLEKDGAWYKITTKEVEGYIYEEFVKKD